jgi:outer membrane immunogenic protein
LGIRCRNGTAKRPDAGYTFNHVQSSHEGLVMKKSLMVGALVTGAVFGALVACNAMAADMPTKAPLMKAPPPAFSWTGCYIGGGGYGMWNQDNFISASGVGVPGITTASTTSGGRGWFGTAGAGCDYQVSSSFVIGAFGDWDFGNIKGQFNPSAIPIVGTESEKWTWAAGGRIGYLVTPTCLTYFSGGYTEAHFDPVNFASAIPGGIIGTTIGIDGHSYKGWFLGSGFEYAISFLPSGFFLKTEYRYATYKAEDLPLVVIGPGFGGGTAFLNSEKFVQTIRSELVFRFNMFH